MIRLGYSSTYIIYLLTFYAWVEDNTLSLEKTMNALDKNLDHAEKFGKYLNWLILFHIKHSR